MKQSPELAYVLGVLITDSYSYVDKGRNLECDRHWKIRLHAKDKNFVEFFALNISKLLNRNYNVWKEGNKDLYRIEASSKELFVYYKKWKQLNLYEKYPLEFLKGVFDGDGGASIFTRKFTDKIYRYSVITFTNINKGIINLIANLLRKHLDIFPKIYIKRCKGARCFDKWMSTRDQYQLMILKKDDVKIFMKFIGFRKKIRKSEDFLNLIGGE
jgi:intein-encoded DNA endonuclease-like protein